MLPPSVCMREHKNKNGYEYEYEYEYGYEYEYERMREKGQEKEGTTSKIELPKLIDQQRSIKHL